MATKNAWIQSIMFIAGSLENVKDEDMPEELETLVEEIDGLRDEMGIE